MTVERWSVDALDFLELSIRADTEVEATRAQAPACRHLARSGTHTW